jgi:hypothetical protein
VNIFSCVKHLRPDKNVNRIVSETAEATGIFKTSGFKIRSESACGPLVTPCKYRKRKGVRINRREVKYDDLSEVLCTEKLMNFIFETYTKF